MKLSASTYEPHPEGAYVAEIAAWEERSTQWGEQIMWSLMTDVLRVDGEPAQLRYFTRPTSSPRGKLYAFLMACGIEPPAAGLDEAATMQLLDGVLGRQLLVKVIHEEKDDQTFANIVAVKPVPPGKVKAAPPPPPPPPPPPLDEEDPFADQP